MLQFSPPNNNSEYTPIALNLFLWRFIYKSIFVPHQSRPFIVTLNPLVIVQSSSLSFPLTNRLRSPYELPQSKFNEFPLIVNGIRFPLPRSHNVPAEVVMTVAVHSGVGVVGRARAVEREMRERERERVRMVESILNCG